MSSSGPVAIVSGDPDGKYETVERLDKVRDDIGQGEIRIVLPKRPMARETWFEVSQATEGCRLLILDNLTQFVPTSLNDDSGVKLVYEQLQILARTGMAVCVLAHTSDKKNEHGYSSDVPLGSTVIRTVPRWFVYLKRSRGVLTAAMSGNGGRPWELTLTEPSDTPRFDVIAETPADELAERRGQRTKAALDQNAQISKWMHDHPDMKQVDVAGHFKVSQATISRIKSMGIHPS